MLIDKRMIIILIMITITLALNSSDMATQLYKQTEWYAAEDRRSITNMTETLLRIGPKT